MGRPAVRIIAICTLALALGAAAAVYWGYDAFHRPGPAARSVTVIIPKGAALGAIADLLQENRLIDHRLVFIVGARLTDRDRRMRAGEYAFPASVSMDGAIALIVSGETVKRRLTIAEGLTSTQALALVRMADGLTGDVGPRVAEGVLLPETYFYSHDDTRRALIGRMRAAMSEILPRLWRGRANGLAINSPAEMLTLASIIEKETGVESERPRISAVFHNRLRRRMRLQSDPTVVFALTEGRGPLARRLTRRDLAISSPYNTYRHRGLPPGPIANPGRSAMFAALHPSDSKELYFVANGEGGHVFARTLAEHNRNVRKWRRIRRAREKP